MKNLHKKIVDSTKNFLIKRELLKKILLKENVGEKDLLEDVGYKDFYNSVLINEFDFTKDYNLFKNFNEYLLLSKTQQQYIDEVMGICEKHFNEENFLVNYYEAKKNRILYFLGKYKKKIIQSRERFDYVISNQNVIVNDDESINSGANILSTIDSEIGNSITQVNGERNNDFDYEIRGIDGRNINLINYDKQDLFSNKGVSLYCSDGFEVVIRNLNNNLINSIVFSLYGYYDCELLLTNGNVVNSFKETNGINYIICFNPIQNNVVLRLRKKNRINEFTIENIKNFSGYLNTYGKNTYKKKIYLNTKYKNEISRNDIEIVNPFFDDDVSPSKRILVEGSEVSSLMLKEEVKEYNVDDSGVIFRGLALKFSAEGILKNGDVDLTNETLDMFSENVSKRSFTKRFVSGRMIFKESDFGKEGDSGSYSYDKNKVSRPLFINRNDDRNKEVTANDYYVFHYDENNVKGPDIRWGIFGEYVFRENYSIKHVFKNLKFYSILENKRTLLDSENFEVYLHNFIDSDGSVVLSESTQQISSYEIAIRRDSQVFTNTSFNELIVEIEGDVEIVFESLSASKQFLKRYDFFYKDGSNFYNMGELYYNRVKLAVSIGKAGAEVVTTSNDENTVVHDINFNRVLNDDRITNGELVVVSVNSFVDILDKIFNGKNSTYEYFVLRRESDIRNNNDLFTYDRFYYYEDNNGSEKRVSVCDYEVVLEDDDIYKPLLLSDLR